MLDVKPEIEIEALLDVPDYFVDLLVKVIVTGWFESKQKLNGLVFQAKRCGSPIFVNVAGSGGLLVMIGDSSQLSAAVAEGPL
jgi:hypothetical protein